MLVALVWCLGATGIEAQSLVINEVLASNSSFDYDDFFQFEDWIEIYNGGGILNLEGYHLSDDPDTLDKWMFPSTNPGLTTICLAATCASGATTTSNKVRTTRISSSVATGRLYSL